MYNKSEIMKEAWRLFRGNKSLAAKYRRGCSWCLKSAWRKAKIDAKAETLINDAVVPSENGIMYIRYGVVDDCTMGWNVFGKTFYNKREIRRLGFLWSPETKCWYTTDKKTAKSFVKHFSA